jgi:menaquinone-dependent protoporphyrinogen IX oxidase
MTNKVLIAFATKNGATKDTAEQIAQVLRSKYSMEVDLVDLQRDSHPALLQYNIVLVASGIRMGKWYNEALQFLKSNFQGKTVALFVSAMYQGGNPETYPIAVERYLESVAKEFLNVKPIAMEVFGGRMKFLGRVTADNRDQNKINEWAQNLGEKLCNPESSSFQIEGVITK